MSGDSFLVRDAKLFSENVIPTVYKHNNFSSFVRQLNFCEWPCSTSSIANATAMTDTACPLLIQMASARSNQIYPPPIIHVGNSGIRNSFAECHTSFSALKKLFIKVSELKKMPSFGSLSRTHYTSTSTFISCHSPTKLLLQSCLQRRQHPMRTTILGPLSTNCQKNCRL